MLRIPCPLCGERDYTEFHYGGDAGKRRARFWQRVRN
jgi:sarcosine oxidase delta subunit